MSSSDTVFRVPKGKKRPTLRASHLAKFVKEFRYTWTHFKFEREWKKLQRQEDKYFGIFNTKTLAIYFAHGKVREEQAWNSLMSLLSGEATRESKRAQAFNIHEKAYAERDPLLKLAPYAFEGNEGIEAETFTFAPYDLRAKPDGLIGDHVIEIKCPVGNLPKVIARNYKLQMFTEMACHNRRKTYFYQYYEPAGWYYFFKYLCDQYYNLQNLKPLDVVYRPWFDNDYSMLVIFRRAEKVLYTLDTTHLRLVNLFWEYCMKEERLPRPKGKDTPKDKDDWDVNRSAAISLIMNITEDKLMAHGFSRWESRCIIDALCMEGNDMKMGHVLELQDGKITILWQGQRSRKDDMSRVIDKNTGAFQEVIDFTRYRRGLVKIMSRMNHQISGRPQEGWLTWAQDMRQGNVTPLPKIPQAKYSLHRVSIQETKFKVILTQLQNFLVDLKRGTYPFKRGKGETGSGNILCKGLDDLMDIELLSSGVVKDYVPSRKRKAPGNDNVNTDVGNTDDIFTMWGKISADEIYKKRCI